jgi:uncharacterized cupin superfamily protein
VISKRAFDLPATTGTMYPEPFRSRVLPREKRALGDAFGLSTIGVNLTILAPGKESSMRHWHEREDELVYVLEGEVVLITDDGEEILGPGMVAGFKAGISNAHQLVNRGEGPATYLEVSNRDAADWGYYPDVDMAYGKDSEGNTILVHKDGTPF